MKGFNLEIDSVTDLQVAVSDESKVEDKVVDVRLAA